MARQTINKNLVEPFSGPNTGLGQEFGDKWNEAVDKLNAMLTELYAGAGAGSGGITISTIAPVFLQAGQLWWNPTTQLISLARIPSFAWSPNLSNPAVIFSNSNLTAQRSDAAYPNIVTGDVGVAGVRSASTLPTAQKYVFAIGQNFTVLDGSSGFGIGIDGNPTGNAMFLDYLGLGIGFYADGTGYYYFENNAQPPAPNGHRNTGSTPNGTYYVAVDPVAKLIWVKPPGGSWNGDPANDPGAGTGGVTFTINVTTSRIIGQFARNGDGATVDPTATGLTLPAGFTPISQIVLWTPLTYVNPSAISGGLVNIKDFGALGNGGDDGAAFQAFTEAYQGKEVALYIPPGTYTSVSNSNGLWRGIKKLTIFGYGASLSGNLNQFGGTNDQYGAANSALVQSAGQNSTQLTLVNSGDASKFSVGDWLLLGALDIEAGGIPPNPYFMEFVQVTTVSGGVIFLNSYLRGGPYLSTYPAYTANSFGVNEGGPATVWNMTKMFGGQWECDVSCFGVTFLGGSDMPPVMNKYYRDCKWPGLQSSNFPIPSQAKSITFENCLIQGGGDIEVDKCIERLTFRNCEITGYYNTLLFQSSSVQQLIIDGCNIGNLNGTPKDTYIRDSYIGNLTPGPRSNGPFESIYIENSYVDVISFTGWGNSFGNANNISAFTFSNGTFSIPNTGPASLVPWAAPGVRCAFSEGGFFQSPPFFTVLNVRSDTPGVAGTGNILIDTTLTSLPSWTQGSLPSAFPLPSIIAVHPYPKITVKNCRGHHLLQNWQMGSNPSRDGGPGFTYGHIVLTGNVSPLLGATNNMQVRGTLTSININVLRAYTGANGSENLFCDSLQGYTPAFVGYARTLGVNVKTAGVRSWSAGSWSGSVTGDSLPAMAVGDWIFGYLEWYYDNTMAGDNLAQMPIVIIEIITDAGMIKYDLFEYGHLAGAHNFIAS
jgi:hypothetical protein